MNNSPSTPSLPVRLERRDFLQLTGFAALTALAGCGSLRPTGGGCCASSSATSIING